MAFKDVHYGVVVMDIRLPDMDGYTAFREIEAHCQQCGREPPSGVFITGVDPPPEVLRLIRDNPRHALLRKPVSHHALVTVLRERLAAPCGRQGRGEGASSASAMEGPAGSSGELQSPE